jgi:hypothetical protein
MVNLTRAADTVKAHLAFIRAGNFVWQMGYIQNTNSFGIFPFNFSGTQGTPTMTWTTSGNVGIGTTSPNAKLDVRGVANITNTSPYAVPNNYMQAGSLTIGDRLLSYGGNYGWTPNTAGLLMECLSDTEIAVHDSGDRIASFMYYLGNIFTIGRDMGWGVANTNFLGRVGIGVSSPGYALDVSGDIKATGSVYVNSNRMYRTKLNYTSSAFYPLIDLPGGAFASRVTIHFNASPAAAIAFYFIDAAGNNTYVSEYNVTYFRAGQYSTGAGNAYIAQYNEAGTGGICEFLISKVTGRAHFNITSAFCWPGVGATRSQGQGYTTGNPNRIVLYSIPAYNVEWWSVTENYYI